MFRATNRQPLVGRQSRKSWLSKKTEILLLDLSLVVCLVVLFAWVFLFYFSVVAPTTRTLRSNEEHQQM